MLIALILALMTVFPLVWMLIVAVKPPAEVFAPNIVPHAPTTANFLYVLTEIPFLRYLFNSLVVSVAVTVAALFFHSMAGYALRGADTESASATTPARLVIAGRVAAGHVAERPLRPGEAFRIFTGGPLPEGADSVIPQEDVNREGSTLVVPRAVKIGDYVRPRGEDVRAGDAVLEPGRLLGPAEVGILAALGRSQVRVTRRPERIAEPIRPAIRGRVDRPLVVAFTPWPICMKIGRKATVDMNDMEIRKPARLAVENTRFLNRSSGRIGSEANRSAKM